MVLRTSSFRLMPETQVGGGFAGFRAPFLRNPCGSVPSVVGMRIEPIGARSYVGPESVVTGVSAALAEAQKMLRAAAPQGSWGTVRAEVSRVQAAQSLTLLDALYTVFGRLADGTYVPQRSA